MPKTPKKPVKKGPRAPRVTPAAALIPDPIEANAKFEKFLDENYPDPEANRLQNVPMTPDAPEWIIPAVRSEYANWLATLAPGPKMLTKDQYRDILLNQMARAYRIQLGRDPQPEGDAPAPEGDAPPPPRPPAAYTPELPNFVDPNSTPEISPLPTLPGDKSLLAYDRATHLRRNQAVTIPPYELQSEKRNWTDKNGNAVEIQLGRDRPEPYARGLTPMDEATLRAVYELARRAGRLPFLLTNNALAREVYAIPQGQYVSTRQRDDVRTRMAYFTGLAGPGQPANLKWYGMVERDGKKIVDAHDHIINASEDRLHEGWTIYALPSTVIQANALGQLGTIARGLLAAGAKRTSHTAIRTAFADWILARLHDFQHTGANAEFEAKEAEAKEAEAKEAEAKEAEAKAKAARARAEAARPVRKIWLAEMLAETWAHAAYNPPKGKKRAAYRDALRRRRDVIEAIVDDLREQGAVAACRYDWNAIPPPETWPDGTEYPTPRGAIIVTGPFVIQDRKKG